MHAHDEVISVSSFEESLARYQQCYDEIYFRGEVKEFPKREPGILRDKGYWENEGNMYQDMMHMYSDQMNKARGYIGQLALLQHYSVPTRLLDITVNPLIALYFACEKQGAADDEDGYVFMYIRNGKKVDSPEVYALSLHACFPNLSDKEIAQRIKQERQEVYTEEQIHSFIHTPVFLKESADLNVGNERIVAQAGSFFICADDENGGLVTLDSVLPVCVFRIPATYKEVIRSELDEKGVNVRSVYPELSSGGIYLKQKYKKDNYHIDKNDYEISEIECGKSNRRNTNICIKILNVNLSIKHVKEIVRHVCENYENVSDVIWIYVGFSTLDIENKNWRLMGRWINPSWENKTIEPLKEKDGDFSWQNNAGSTIISDFYKEDSDEEMIHPFIQTIPMCDDAIEVSMEIKYKKNEEGKFIVSGKTNLFDGAELMISIIPNGQIWGPSCKAICKDNCFASQPLGNGKNLSGKCSIEVILSASSSQSIEFVKKAGMQYEHLKGAFIVRDSISPMGKYEQEVML